MVRTKQTARKESGSGMQRAKFPAATPQSETCLAAQVEQKTQPEDTEPRADTEDSETGLREVEPAALTSQQQRTQIVLPRHMSVSGMDPSFIRYYREHGMTPYLMESLMTKRGWTLEMINRVIKNCNSAWKTECSSSPKHPVQ